MVPSLSRFDLHFFQMTDKIVVLSTCAGEEEAERIARKLVETRLAACVNVVPRVRSFYRWQGALESADECLLVIKSSRDLFDALSAVLEQAHSYELPEALALPVIAGSRNYLHWLGENLLAEPE
jgi:periplasmic divalent cation tolerance protein